MCDNHFVMCHIITLSPLDPSSKDNGIARTFISICQSPLTQGYHVIKKLYQKCTTNMSHEENLIIEPSVKLIGHYLPMPIHAK